MKELSFDLPDLKLVVVINVLIDLKCMIKFLRSGLRIGPQVKN